MQHPTGTGETFSLEEYIQLDEKGLVRHEFYYGKLFEMPGASILHNNVCLRLYVLLFSHLQQIGFQVNVENVKVKITGEEVYLYPDVLVTNEQFASMNDYIVYQPSLIAEVLSDSTRKYDSTDKFIQYQKITSLRYYLLVEPEKRVIIFYEKLENGEWSAKTLTDMDEVISLPFFPAQILLANIYS